MSQISARRTSTSSTNPFAFAPLPHGLTRDRCLGDGHYRLLGALLEDAQTSNHSTATVPDLAKALGKSVRSVQYYLWGLLELGILFERPDPESPSGRRLHFEWRYFHGDGEYQGPIRLSSEETPGATGCTPEAESPPISCVVIQEDPASPLNPPTTTTVSPEAEPTPKPEPAEEPQAIPQEVAEDNTVPLPKIQTQASKPAEEAQEAHQAIAGLKAMIASTKSQGTVLEPQKPLFRSVAAERLRARREACQPVDLSDPNLARVMAAEARAASSQPPPLPKPKTIWEALERLQDPLVTAPEVAGMLAITFHDHKTVSYRFFCRVIERAKNGIIAVEAVVKAVRFALAAKNPGAYFVRCCS